MRLVKLHARGITHEKTITGCYFDVGALSIISEKHDTDYPKSGIFWHFGK